MRLAKLMETEEPKDWIRLEPTQSEEAPAGWSCLELVKRPDLDEWSIALDERFNGSAELDAAIRSLLKNDPDLKHEVTLSDHAAHTLIAMLRWLFDALVSMAVDEERRIADAGFPADPPATATAAEEGGCAEPPPFKSQKTGKATRPHSSTSAGAGGGGGGGGKRSLSVSAVVSAAKKVLGPELGKHSESEVTKAVAQAGSKLIFPASVVASSLELACQRTSDISAPTTLEPVVAIIAVLEYVCSELLCLAGGNLEKNLDSTRAGGEPNDGVTDGTTDGTTDDAVEGTTEGSTDGATDGATDGSTAGVVGIVHLARVIDPLCCKGNDEELDIIFHTKLGFDIQPFAAREQEEAAAEGKVNGSGGHQEHGGGGGSTTAAAATSAVAADKVKAKASAAIKNALKAAPSKRLKLKELKRRCVVDGSAVTKSAYKAALVELEAVGRVVVVDGKLATLQKKTKTKTKTEHNTGNMSEAEGHAEGGATAGEPAKLSERRVMREVCKCSACSKPQRRRCIGSSDDEAEDYERTEPSGGGGCVCM